MPISVDCPHCGKTLRAKDSAAGKTAKCPSCQGLINLPMNDEVYDAEEASTEDSESTPDFGDSYGSPAIPEAGRRACPACGEMVAELAKKCRHCGEIFDEELKRKKSARRKSSAGRSSGAPLADLGKRFLGAMADGLSGLLFIGPGFGLIIASNPDAPGENEELAIAGVIALLLGGLVMLGLQIYLLATRSQSIGKYLVNTQIMDFDTGEPASFVKTFLLRSIVNGIINGLPVVGGCYGLIDILFIFGEERRCIHDHIAGTYVADIS
jgi:uncharacterized RDD family membrane protein YckC/phage FluMu protein Com